jgi:hypothetical protein
LPDIAYLSAYHLAMAEHPDARTFTMRLNRAVEAKALARPDTSDWLRRRIALRLKEGLGRNVELFGCLEVDDNEGLHVHGQFIVSDNEIVRAKECLRKAGGKWPTMRHKQAHSHNHAPDIGWPSYFGKDLHKASGFVRDLLARHGSPHLFVPYNGSPVFASQGIRRRARVLFNDLRRQLMKANLVR